MKTQSAIQVLLATLGIAIGGSTIVLGAVTGISYLYGNGKTNPGTTLAGYLATADGGVVNVMGSPAPTAVGQALRSITIGTAATAGFVSDPDGGVSGSGTAGYIPEWTRAHELGNSRIYDNGSLIGIGGPSNVADFDFNLTAPNHPLILGLASGGSLWAGIGMDYWTAGIRIAGDPLGNNLLLQVGYYTYDSNHTWVPSASFRPSGLTLTGTILAANLPDCKTGQLLVGGTSTSTDTNTSTTTSRTCQTVPVASTSSPGFLQLSTQTPLVNIAGGVAGNGTEASPWNHQHPISTIGKTYYVTSWRAFSTTKPASAADLTATVSSLKATINVDTGTGEPNLAVWPGGTLNYEVWAKIENPVGGHTYTLMATSPPTITSVGAIRGIVGEPEWDTSYQTGSSTAGSELTTSWAKYTFALPVSQLTGDQTAFFRVPFYATTTSGGDGAILHISVGSTQATSVGTLFYEVPNLSGVEYQNNKGAMNGYCPLNSSALVPSANLPAATASVAGITTLADHKVAAASGATPGYLDAVCESTDSSITIGQTGNYVTFAANFGTSATQVCSGSTCAGLQSQLPACVPGQVEQFGTVTQTGTATSTTTTRSCQNSPWQVAGSYQPTLPGGTNGQVPQYSTTATGTTTNLQPATLPTYVSMSLATQARIAAASGTASSTNTQAMPADAKVALATDGRVALATGTAVSTATNCMPGDAQVRFSSQFWIPANAGTSSFTSTSAYAVIPAGSFVAIGDNTPTKEMVAFASTTTATATGTSTVPVNNISWKYIQEGNIVGLTTDLAGKQASLGTASQGYMLYAGATSTSTSTTSSPYWGPRPAVPTVSISTSTPVNVTNGPASAGTATTLSASDHVHHLGDNTAHQGDVLLAATGTTTSTSTTTRIGWFSAPWVRIDQINTLVTGRLLKETIFTATNTSFALQSATMAVDLYGRAGGGQGGGAQVTYSAYFAVGGGGAQGGSVQAVTTSIASPISVVVGAGGTGANCTGGGAGTRGGDTTITINGTAYSAVAGLGGIGMLSSSVVQSIALGGIGYNTASGAINLGGASGMPGQVLHNAYDPVLAFSGAGGGEGGGQATASVGSYSAQGPGGGGGGAYAGGGGATCVNGGAGGSGWAMIREYN